DPLAHRTRGHAQGLGDACLLPAVLPQLQGAKPTPLPPVHCGVGQLFVAELLLCHDHRDHIHHLHLCDHVVAARWPVARNAPPPFYRWRPSLMSLLPSPPILRSSPGVYPFVFVGVLPQPPKSWSPARRSPGGRRTLVLAWCGRRLLPASPIVVGLARP